MRRYYFSKKKYLEDEMPEQGIPTVPMLDLLTANPERQYERVSDGLIMSIVDGKYNWAPHHKPLSPDDRWVEVEQEKEVPFLEAVQARDDGKTVICKWEFEVNTYKGGKGVMIDQKQRAVSSDEILYGHWFIKGDK